jgi:transposase
MKKNDEELPTTDTEQIERLIERFKQGRLEPGDTQSIEKLLRLLLTIISFLQGKNSTLLRLKEVLFGGKKRKPDSDKSEDSGEEQVSGLKEKDSTGSPKESACRLMTEGDSETDRPKRRGHGRLPAATYTGAKVVNLKHEEMGAGDPCPNPDCRGHLQLLSAPRIKIYLTGQPLITATRYEREDLRCSDCFSHYPAKLPDGVKEEEKFDETADVGIVLSKLMAATPYYRRARMQASCEVPSLELSRPRNGSRGEGGGGLSRRWSLDLAPDFGELGVIGQSVVKEHLKLLGLNRIERGIGCARPPAQPSPVRTDAELNRSLFHRRPTI